MVRRFLRLDGQDGSLVESEDNRFTSVSGFFGVAQVNETTPFMVVWYGDNAGGRVLLMPNEVAIQTPVKVYFRASVLVTFNGSMYYPISEYAVILGYNRTYALRFDMVDANYSWVYNLYTVTYQEYEEQEQFVRLLEYLQALYDARLTVLVGAIVGIPLAYKTRRWV